MKISNKKNIETIGLFLLILIPVNLIVMISYLLIFKINLVFFFLLLLLVIVLVFFAKLRYTEFENSGYVITIKKRHPLRANRFIFPTLEFPVDMLKGSHLKYNTIYLNVITSMSESEKPSIFRMSLKGFSSQQRIEILASLLINDQRPA